MKTEKAGIVLCLNIFMFFSSMLGAQTRLQDTTIISGEVDVSGTGDVNRAKVPGWEPTTSVFLELFGKGYYSLNIDFRKSERSSVSAGLQVAEEIMPSIMIYRFLGKRNRLETGGGLGGVFAWNDGFLGMSVHGVLGYRYQKKGGLLFRAGFTPLIGIPFQDEGDFGIIPFAGVSLGYSF